MVIKQVSLETVCGITSVLPQNTKAEVAFAGKSNVGKSSLINGLMNRKSLARTSAQPGKTQTINFYNVNDTVYLVDLPGYGYAKVSQSEKEKWGKLIERYLHGSRQLRAVFLLVDIRHEPGENDRTMYEWICSNGYEPVIIATKLDKIKRSQLSKQLKLIREGLQTRPGARILPYSSLTKQGREEIWAAIGELCELSTGESSAEPVMMQNKNSHVEQEQSCRTRTDAEQKQSCRTRTVMQNKNSHVEQEQSCGTKTGQKTKSRTNEQQKAEQTNNKKQPA